MRESLFRGRLAAQVLAGLPTGRADRRRRRRHRHPRDRPGRGGAGAAVVGIEPDPEALAIARGKDGAAAVEWQPGLAGELPLADGSCDRVMMSLLLHHLDAGGKRAALAEAHRVLRHGGRIHIADWGTAQDPLMRSDLLRAAAIDGFAGTRDHVAGRLPGFVEAAGFAGLERHDRLRTAWGSLELLSAARNGA